MNSQKIKSVLKEVLKIKRDGFWVLFLKRIILPDCPNTTTDLLCPCVSQNEAVYLKRNIPVVWPDAIRN